MRRNIFYSTIIATLLILMVVIFARNKFLARQEAGISGTERAASMFRSRADSEKIKRIQGEVDIRNAFIEVADKVGRAVVTISTERTQKIMPQRQPFSFRGPGLGDSPFQGESPFEKFFEDFFGRFPEKEFKQKGLGSGFIIDAEGHILTNYHVIEGAEKINVTIPDGRNFDAIVQGADPRRDLAVIKIDAKDIPVSSLGDSELVEVGEWVVALGNPFGHILKSPKPTVTAGVISALHRQIPAPGGSRGYLDMIQTDAAINPGNSGGPLCDLNGNVIGINVAIFSTTGGYQGLGFAIPINEAKRILSDLIAGKEIAYGWIGIGVQDITPEIAQYFGLPDIKGVLISQLVPEGPAKKAGLQEGDIIRSIDGAPINSVNDLLREINDKNIGEVVDIGIIRDGQKIKISTEIGKRPDTAAMGAERKEGVQQELESWRGIVASDINDDIARKLGLTDKDGVVVMQIKTPSPAYEAGLRPGDIIREINRAKIHNLDDYRNAISSAQGVALVRTDRGYFVLQEEKP